MNKNNYCILPDNKITCITTEDDLTRIKDNNIVAKELNKNRIPVAKNTTSITLTNNKILNYNISSLKNEHDKPYEKATEQLICDNREQLSNNLKKNRKYFKNIFSRKQYISLIVYSTLLQCSDCLIELLIFHIDNNIYLNNDEQKHIINFIKSKKNLDIDIFINVILKKNHILLKVEYIYELLKLGIKETYKNIITKTFKLICNKHEWYFKNNNINPLYEAIILKKHESLNYLLAAVPKYSIYYTDNSTPIIQAILHKNTYALNKLIEYEKKYKTLFWKNNNADIAINLAIKKRYYNLIEILLKANPKLLFSKNKTIINNIFYKDHILADIILKNKFIKNKVLNMNYFPEAPNKNYSLSSKYLADARSKYQLPFKNLVIKHKNNYNIDITNKLTNNLSKKISSYLDINTNNLSNYNIDITNKLTNNLSKKISSYLDINTNNLSNYNNNMLFHVVKNKLSYFTEIAIYIKSQYYCESDNSYCYNNDESDSVDLIDTLINLGVKKILLIISSPNENRLNIKQNNHLIRYDYTKQKMFFIKKLSYSLDSLNYNTTKMQKIKRFGCDIHIGFADDKNFLFKTNKKIKIYPGLIFTFSTSEMYKELFANNVINIKPSRLKKHFEQIHTDLIKTKDNSICCNVTTLRNNDNCIIPVQDNQQIPLRYGNQFHLELWIHSELKDYFPQIIATNLAVNINSIINLAKKKDIQHSVICGNSHNKVIDNSDMILQKWLEVLNQLYLTEDKSIVLSIISSNLILKIDNFFTKNNNIIFININSNRSVTLLHDSIKNKKIIITVYSELPKKIINYMICNSTIPVLIEDNNANFLLQKGCPYLSIIPNEANLIYKNIGDPLQALQLEALSYKLIASETNILQLDSLYKYLIKKKFLAAIGLIMKYRRLKDNPAIKNIAFLWGKDEKNYLYSENKVTVYKLIMKGDNLSNIEYKTLLEVLNTDLSTITHYIKRVNDPCSKENIYIDLIKSELSNNYNNNTVIIALYQFFQIKKLI